MYRVTELATGYLIEPDTSAEDISLAWRLGVLAKRPILSYMDAERELAVAQNAAAADRHRTTLYPSAEFVSDGL